MNRVPHQFVFTVALALWSAGSMTQADVTVDLSGRPGSRTVTMVISGGGVWSHFSADRVILFSDVDDAFADSGLEIGSGNRAPTSPDWISLDTGATLINDDEPIVLDRLYIRDDQEGSSSLRGIGDDFSLGASSGYFTSVPGEAWSIAPQRITFDIGLLGDPDSNATFDNLGLGEHTGNAFTTSHDAGELSLTVTRIPEPATMWLLAVGVASSPRKAPGSGAERRPR